MGKLDIADRAFFSESARFAELVNHIFAQGRNEVYSGDLTLVQRNYTPLSDSSGGKERDILMYDERKKIYYGLEIETESDYSIPERIMVYDVSEYEEQIKEIHKKNKGNKRYKTYRGKIEIFRRCF